jgi:hypothetical protein
VKTKLKPIHALLLVAILAVWGSIGLQVFDAVSEPGTDVAMTSGPRRARSAALDGESFKADLRDPFLWGAMKRDAVERPMPKTMEPSAVIQPPAIRLVGIVLGEKGRTALVELEDGTTAFLSRRDTLLGVRVDEIEAKKVQYSFRGLKGTWRLD